MNHKVKFLNSCKGNEAKVKVRADIWCCMNYMYAYFKTMADAEKAREDLHECDGILPYVRDWVVYEKVGRRWVLSEEYMNPTHKELERQ